MSMEFFAWPWAEGFFGADARKFRYSHLAGALVFIPYGTMVDHFQHIVYEKPEMTPAQRHAGLHSLCLRLPAVDAGLLQAAGWHLLHTGARLGLNGPAGEHVELEHAGA